MKKVPEKAAKDSSMSRGLSIISRAVANHWFERTIFVLGSLTLFSSEQILTNYVDDARDDVEYFEKNMSQFQITDAARQHWLAEYNRAVAMRPQVRYLIGESAFELFVDVDEIVSQLKAVIEQNGRGEVFSIIKAKNDRREAAANELKNGDIEAVVARLNKIMPEYEAQVEPLVGQLILKRQKALSDEIAWNRRVKWARFLGAILLAGAFLLREAKDYIKSKRLGSAKSVR
jgi:hypothetical protein